MAECLSGVYKAKMRRSALVLAFSLALFLPALLSPVEQARAEALGEPPADAVLAELPFLEGPLPYKIFVDLAPEQNAKRLGFEHFKMLCGEGAALPAAHIPTVLQAMRTGKPYPVKAFLIFGNNTLTTYGDTNVVYDALMKLDFIVCADLFMTPTAELADIVLPAAFWAEINEVAGLPTIA